MRPKTWSRRNPPRKRASRSGRCRAARSFPARCSRSKNFKPEELAELVDSIKERGVIQPLIVRLVNGKYELIAGERRWRAAGEAGLETLPVIVREASNRDVLELALIENLQRADLNPIEEAEAYARLMKEFSLTQEQVAHQVGKGRVVVANAVRLLALPEQLRAWIGTGDLTVGHAKALLGLDNAEEQTIAAERVRKENLTVRATERLVETMRAGTRPARKRKVASAGRRGDFRRSREALAASRRYARADRGQGRRGQDRDRLFHAGRPESHSRAAAPALRVIWPR